MFDNVPVNNQGAGAPPANLPSEPVDMFAGVDKVVETAPAAPDALSAGKLQRKESVAVSTMQSSNASAPVSVPTYEVKGPVLGKIFLVMGVILVVGGVGFGGWWIYNHYFNNGKVPVAPVSENTNVTPTDNTGVVLETNPSAESWISTSTSDQGLTATSSDISTEMNSDKILFGNQVDSDNDGLDNVRETELGTDPNNPDTDGDGLNDYEEVVYWKTNPLKADTDSDGFGDGKEVKAGYNPLGQGKLTKEQASIVSSTVKTSSSTTPAVSSTTAIKKK